MNIGFVTWFRKQGSAYLALQLAEKLSKLKHNTSIFAYDQLSINTHPRESSYLYASLNYSAWLSDFKPNLIFFIYHAPNELISKALKLGIKTAYLVMWERTKDFTNALRSSTYLIAPTNATNNFLLSKGYSSVRRINMPWGLDIDPLPKVPPSKPYKLLYLGGFPESRRRGDFVFLSTMHLLSMKKYFNIFSLTIAFIDKIYTRDAYYLNQLLGSFPRKITLLSNLDRDSQLKLVRDSDLLLWPTTREGLGLTALESIYLGTPVVCYDFPPVNEYLVNNINSSLCPAIIGKSYEGIPEVRVSTYESFRNTITYALDNLDTLTKNATVNLSSRTSNFNNSLTSFLNSVK